MNNLKRDNWTNDEVIALLGGQRLHGMRNGREKLREFHNGAIDDAIMVFEDFKRPQSELGAMAYDPDGDHIVHIGIYPRHADGDS